MIAGTGRRRIPSVRARTALAAVAAVGAAMILGGIVLIHVLSSSLTSGVDASTRLRTEAVANLVSGGTAPPVLAVPGDDSVVVQVIDGSGRVVAASNNIADEQALMPGSAAPTALRVATLHGLPVGEQGAFRVAWRAVATPQGT